MAMLGYDNIPEAMPDPELDAARAYFDAMFRSCTQIINQGSRRNWQVRNQVIAAYRAAVLTNGEPIRPGGGNAR